MKKEDIKIIKDKLKELFIDHRLYSEITDSSDVKIKEIKQKNLFELSGFDDECIEKIKELYFITNEEGMKEIVYNFARVTFMDSWCYDELTKEEVTDADIENYIRQMLSTYNIKINKLSVNGINNYYYTSRPMSVTYCGFDG